MQTKYLKIFIFIFLYFQSIILNAQYTSQMLDADKLFATKKYQESYKLYYDLFKNGITTPQAVLKMAFIQEGINEPIKALFFMNYFYENYPDKKIFNKMKELADKEQLSGYVYSDLEFFSNVYRNYQKEIILSIMAVVFVYFLAVVTNKIFIKGISNTSPFLFVLFLLLVFYLINHGETFFNPQKGIILNDKALLMNAPSAGSKLIGTASKGNRVIIFKKRDIWAEIQYEDKKCFIRQDNLYNI